MSAGSSQLPILLKALYVELCEIYLHGTVAEEARHCMRMYWILNWLLLISRSVLAHLVSLIQLLRLFRCPKKFMLSVFSVARLWRSRLRQLERRRSVLRVNPSCEFPATELRQIPGGKRRVAKNRNALNLSHLIILMRSITLMTWVEIIRFQTMADTVVVCRPSERKNIVPPNQSLSRPTIRMPLRQPPQAAARIAVTTN